MPRTFSISGGSASLTLPAPIRAISVTLAGLAARIEPLDERGSILGRGGGAELHTDRVADGGGERDVRSVETAGALADPDGVGRQVVGQPGGVLGSGQGALVLQQQRLVAGVQLDLLTGRARARRRWRA